MKELIRFLMVCMMLTAQYVSAVEVKGLFSAQVIASSQSREDRNIALREAFVTVLNRVGAGQGIMLDSAVRKALNNAASYVDQYQYTLISGTGAEKSSRLMRVAFNEQAVLDLLRSRGLPVWSKMRDEVLLWLVIDKRGKQALFDIERDTAINKSLQTAAQFTGIPVLLPLMDLEERQRISVTDINSTDPEKLLLASRRYGVKVILSGKLVKQRSCWHSEWILSFNNKLEQWVVPCEDLTANLTTAFQGVYERLSIVYAVQPEINIEVISN